MFMICSIVNDQAGVSPFPSTPSVPRERIRERPADMPKLGIIAQSANRYRASIGSVLASASSELGGESNPFGREARVADFPDPPVCPPRVEGAHVVDRRRPLPFAARAHNQANRSFEAPRA